MTVVMVRRAKITNLIMMTSMNGEHFIHHLIIHHLLYIPFYTSPYIGNESLSFYRTYDLAALRRFSYHFP